jgi:hypothetical protein
MTRSSGHTFLRANRLLHLYLGVFTAPALLFFAFTGALQTFSLHETTRGSSYKPPAWAVTLGQLHKKQTPVVPVRRPPPAVVAPEGRGDAPEGRGRDREQGPGARNDAGSRGPANAARQALPAAVSEASPATPERTHHPLPLKIFFLIVSVSLFLSTLTGIYMSYKYMRNRTMVTALLILGTAIPVILAFV